MKILDFGLSRVFGSGSGPEGGTPAYMAPEQWRRDAEDERADVFALGSILCEILTGQPAYTGRTDDALYGKASRADLVDAQVKSGWNEELEISCNWRTRITFAPP